ncbi:MAG TPA: phosphopantetheine-binding protein, partial [Pyrinomonadaceae bacterium]
LRGVRGVREAAVVAREGAGGVKELVGYVVGVDGAELSGAGVRGALRGRLPEYMVPGRVEVIAEMPLTPNGKVDRRRLPEPGQQAGQSNGKEYAAPRNEVEEQIASIWQSVLRVEKVSINDNFFDLGGHSLLMVQVHGEVQKKLQVELGMVEMFRHPTVSALAERLVNGGTGVRAEESRDEETSERLEEGKHRLRQHFEQRRAAVKKSEV